ncbi:hypothetical protein CERZMDRAFT_40899 [Cercospora zeae-maydis SCOH1-5]|uniref:L-serine ammonia-lyase n=1 Tax=Cercospora zeae-maydis SCOH1-5 TaxID=717836 RepID=A0A6A6FHM1_9PEZI|nr:hypothetical protein CERZMDRAFT_40899 [Cercospora zeae-maydis SCOH1-5]
MTVSPILPQSIQSHSSSSSTLPSTSKPWLKTPLIESEKLSKAAGCRILLKLDHLQPSGSFKIRGLGHFILKTHQTSPNPSSLHFFSSSGGNAGLAAIYASNFVSCPCTVVVPLSTKPHMIEKLQAAGAKEVVQQGKSWKEADNYMRETVMKSVPDGEEAIAVHPFDHPEVWQGHATIISELQTQMPSSSSSSSEEEGKAVPDYIICSVGGGGLFTGIMHGIQQTQEATSSSPSSSSKWNSHPQPKILAVETHGANSLHQSLQHNQLITLQAITSLATSLGATQVCPRAFALASEGVQTGNVQSVVLSDAEAAMGCVKLWQEEGILVEAACGVNIALCYGGRLEKALGRKPRREEIVVIEVCGGSNVSEEVVEEWGKGFGNIV